MKTKNIIKNIILLMKVFWLLVGIIAIWLMISGEIAGFFLLVVFMAGVTFIGEGEMGERMRRLVRKPAK